MQALRILAIATLIAFTYSVELCQTCQTLCQFDATACRKACDVLCSKEPSPILPDRSKTPGAIFQNATVDEVCEPGYAKRHRNVSEALKKQVYAEYGIFTHKAGDYEIDHLISLELGGSNDITNLWPQSFITKPWNAHVKDTLENKLHELICSKKVPMKTAQQEIATNWIDAYHKYVGPTPSE
jgi:hypothetical protein